MGAAPNGNRARRKHRVPKPVIIGGVVAVLAVVAVAAFVLVPRGPQVRDCLNDYSWEEIAQISKLISEKGDQNGAIEIAEKYHLCTADGKLDGTQTKDITLSDGTQTKVMIMGFNHDDKSDGSGKAGITFIFANDVAKRNMFEKEDLDALFQKIKDNGAATISWEDTSLRSWLSDSFTSELPSDLSSQIVSVDKTDAVMPLVSHESYRGGIYADIDQNSDTTATTASDKLWLPAYVEVGSPNDLGLYNTSGFYSYPLQEGSQYQLFRDAGVEQGTPNSIFGTYDQSGGWWLRTWSTYRSEDGLNPCFLGVCASDSKGGTAAYRNDCQPYSYASDDYGKPKDPFMGVRPAFCI